MSLPKIFLGLSLGSLAVIPVYASNGTVILLTVGALTFFCLKNGIMTAQDMLSSMPNGFTAALLAWIFISLLWEVTLALPYHWWGFNHEAMAGLYIKAWQA